MHYNRRVAKLLALMCVPLLMGGACEKKSAKAGDTGAINALDRADSEQGPVDETPLPGIDLAKLEKDKQKQFYKLMGTLSSPCGKGHNLRTSFSSDQACKRAPFAVRYVRQLLEDVATETQIKQQYEAKYRIDTPVKVDVSKAPRVGNDDAPIRLIEFFDYQCPACQGFKPELESIAANQQGKVVEYFMMFPLEQHKDSKNASQAAVAAAQMGKFKEMHDLLFAKSPRHSKEDVIGYAKQIGLDPVQFEAKYNAAAAQVQADMAQGQAVGVKGTPSLFFNDRKYSGPLEHKYLDMWIEEELAVNR